MSLRLSEEEYATLMKRRALPCVPAKASGVSLQDMDTPRKRSKYGNQRVEIDGKKFDSKHEAGVWIMLNQRVRAGELKWVLRQVPFELPGGIKYIADFVTVRPDGTIEAVIDAKSEATRKNRVYINKKKQMLACWGINIMEM